MTHIQISSKDWGLYIKKAMTRTTKPSSRSPKNLFIWHILVIGQKKNNVGFIDIKI